MAPLSQEPEGHHYGWLQQGWSEQEAASPHVIGDQSGETKQTSFSAVALPDADLVIGSAPLNLEYLGNPTALPTGSDSAFLPRYSWDLSFENGNPGLSKPGPLPELFTIARIKSNDTGTFSGRGIESYGNLTATTPSHSGDWLAGPTVTPGTEITVSRYVRWANATVPGNEINLNIRFHDGVNWVGVVIRLDTHVVAANAWARLYDSVVVPAGATRYCVRVEFAANSVFTTSSAMDVTGLMTEVTVPESPRPFTTEGFDLSRTILEASLTGDMISTSSYDIDSQFLPRRDFQGVPSGYTEDVLDMFQRQYGQGGVTLPWKSTGPVHAYYPLRGYWHGYTVDGQNAPYYQGSWNPSVFTEFGQFSQFRAPNAIECSRGFTRKDTGSYAQTVRPLWGQVITGTNVNYASYRVRLSENSTISTRISISTGYGTTPDTILECMISRTTGTAGTIGIEGQYAVVGAGSATTVPTATVATTGLDMSQEVGFVLQWGFMSSAQPGATLRVKMYAFDPKKPPVTTPSVVKSNDFSNVARNAIVSSNTFIYRKQGLTCGFRDLVLSQTDGTWPVHYPVVKEPSLVVNTSAQSNIDIVPPENVYSFQGPVPPWTGSGWDYLKMLVAGRGLGLKVEGGKLAISDLFPIGSVTPLTGALSAPTLSISAPGRSRSIDVIANKALTRYSDIGPGAPSTYHSFDLTVPWNEEVKTQITLPPGEIRLGHVYPDVEDADGAPVDWGNAFWQARGRCRATLSVDGVLTLAFRGPGRTYPGLGNGPWKVRGVKIVYTGVLYDPERITLYTGAPEPMVTRDKGGDVDNPFLNSQADVFDRSTWLISSEGSPRVTLKFSVPSSLIDDYRVGQIVSYGWGHFRVMEVDTQKGSCRISCDWFATQAQQSDNWAGMTANDWALYWSGRRAYDVFLRPLASPDPVIDPTPFIRVYPSESKTPTFIDGGSSTTYYGNGVYGTGAYGS